MINNFIIKNWKTIFNIQVVIFVAFAILTFIYYWDKPAHTYFNRSFDTSNLQAVFSLLMTYLFVFFIAMAFIYPILFLIQILSLRKEKGNKKTMKLLILFVLYILSIISVFALYTINNAQAIKALNH